MQPLVVKIPIQHWDAQGADIQSALSNWAFPFESARQGGHVQLDLREVEAIEPWALAMFASFVLRLRSNGCEVEILVSANNPANQYAERMGLISLSAGDLASPPSTAESTGLQLLRGSTGAKAFYDIVSSLGSLLSPEVSDALRYGTAELGRNVVQHAQDPVGGVAIVEHFPQTRSIQIAVSDTGRGIFDALKTNYPELRSNLEALKLAILPHASGAISGGPYGSSVNAGLGLFFCKEICWRTGGSLWLASGDALLGVRDNDSSGRGRVYRQILPWPGTVVVMHIPDHLFADFEELLSVCRELAKQARQEASEVALDFVDDKSAPDLIAKSQTQLINAFSVDDFLEDVDRAAVFREAKLIPALNRGQLVWLHFGGARFVTQSFAHALLFEAFKLPGSLTKLSFLGCTKSTEESIRLVAAYAKASYRQLQF